MKVYRKPAIFLLVSLAQKKNLLESAKYGKYLMDCTVHNVPDMAGSTCSLACCKCRCVKARGSARSCLMQPYYFVNVIGGDSNHLLHHSAMIL